MPAGIGIIGLGTMGGAIARSLVAAGWEVFGLDVDRERQRALAACGIDAVASLADLLEKVEIIVTSLPTASALHSTMLSVAAANKRKVFIETSTLSLEDKMKLKKAMDVAGHVTLDCPISGTGAQALTKDLIVYASGESNWIATL